MLPRYLCIVNASSAAIQDLEVNFYRCPLASSANKQIPSIPCAAFSNLSVTYSI